MRNEARSLVLASGSGTRRALLDSAGIPVRVCPAEVDEAAIRNALLKATPPASHDRIALALAEEKATAVSRGMPDALVIGADQVLSLGARILEKPSSRAEARASLLALHGRTHTLHSAVALAEGGKTTWHDVRSASLTMRAFSEAALERYLDVAGDSVLSSVGAYRIEGPAIQLFESIDGDHTTILGLPMLPLMAELLRREVLLP